MTGCGGTAAGHRDWQGPDETRRPIKFMFLAIRPSVDANFR